MSDWGGLCPPGLLRTLLLRGYTHFVAHETVENEDEKSLKTVESGEDVSHEERLRINVEQAKQPGQTQQHDQHTGTFQPRTICNRTYTLFVDLFNKLII